MEGEIQFTFTPVFTTSRQKHFWVVTTNLDSISYKTVSYFHLSKEILQWQVWIFAQEGSNNNGLKEVLKYKVQVIQSRRLLKLQSVFVPSSLSRRIKYQPKTSSLRHQKFLGYSPPWILRVENSWHCHTKFIIAPQFYQLICYLLYKTWVP